MLHFVLAALLHAHVAQATPGASPAPTSGASAAPSPAASTAPASGASAAPSPGASAAPSPGASAAPSPQASSAPAPAPSPAAPAMPPANFGSPPSGEIPILFNDHHVYATPDRLRQGRVLAALVRGGTVLVPLRSMFEQMGATVSYNPSTKTVQVSKSGATVSVTVGSPQATINGETRPLDVPPEIYQGSVMVPIRVLSEGMGAYVQWVPEKKTVVVRYVTATPPPPPPAPTAAPTAAPTPVPTAAPRKYEAFIAGDYMFGGKVYNEFSPGNTMNNSWTGRAAAEFPLFSIPFMLEVDFRQFQYPHNSGNFAAGTPCNVPPPLGAQGDQGCVTVIGGGGQTFVPAFRARENDSDVRLGVRVIDPRIYIGVGYEYRSTNYGYPKFDSFGFGIEKLPDLEQIFSWYAQYWYFPNSRGKYSNSVGQTFGVAYTVQKYELGVTIGIPHTPVYIDLGFLGDRGNAKDQSPIGYTHNGFYSGLGLHF